MTKKELIAIRRRLGPKLRSNAALVLNEIKVNASDIEALLESYREAAIRAQSAAGRDQFHQRTP
jgi:hypothetical protein